MLTVLYRAVARVKKKHSPSDTLQIGEIEKCFRYYSRVLRRLARRHAVAPARVPNVGPVRIIPPAG